MEIKNVLSIVAIICIAFSCNQPEESTKESSNEQLQHTTVKEYAPSGEDILLTNQIVYDVLISDKEEEAWWFQNMKEVDRSNFINLIIDAVQQGKLTAYQPQIGVITNQEEYAMTKDDFNEMVASKEEIARATFIEEWYFDSVNLKMNKKVNGLAFAKSVYTEDGELKGFQRLFYVWFNDVELLDME